VLICLAIQLQTASKTIAVAGQVFASQNLFRLVISVAPFLTTLETSGPPVRGLMRFAYLHERLPIRHAVTFEKTLGSSA
jgi:hypothetical protein